MDSRSIDFANTASIDMMTLNNKVVNMRQVVKRTKVHVISKLCKHIHMLKKKKGTEEQKIKNLRKAERFIEEIDSIKKLKEDKVSKYALANTVSFDEMSKVSLLPGPRALARLADHPLMKAVVTEFRDQHSDWRDLAAYLLVKQTGRRFKTKKQKQKKLARCIENINASEMMTKAYIRERFGQEGLTKAEQTFERKRKRQKSAVGGNHVDSEQSKKHKTEKTSSEDNRSEDLIENKEQPEKTSENVASCLKKSKIMIMENEKKSQEAEKLNQMSHDLCIDSDDSDNERETANCRISPELDENSSSENSEIDDSRDKIAVISDKHTPDEDTIETAKDKTKQMNECVVKELKLESTDDTVLDDDDDSVSESDTNANQQKSQSSSFDDDDERISVEENSDKCKKHKTRQIPELLTKTNKTTGSYPFFAGSHQEDLQDKITADADHSDDNTSDVDMSSSKVKTESMFYNSHSYGDRVGGTRSQSGRGGSSSYARTGAPGRFDTGQRGRKFRGDSRGRTLGEDSRGRTFREDSRGRTFREDSQGRGRSFGGSDKKFTSQHYLGKNNNRAGHMGTGAHTRVNRFIGGRAAELETSHGLPNAPTANKTAQEKLHPSWEASKKRRAEQSGITTFQGSKLTFDDDDD